MLAYNRRGVVEKFVTPAPNQVPLPMLLMQLDKGLLTET
jgi:hypothetical protein